MSWLSPIRNSDRVPTTALCCFAAIPGLLWSAVVLWPVITRPSTDTLPRPLAASGTSVDYYLLLDGSLSARPDSFASIGERLRELAHAGPGDRISCAYFGAKDMQARIPLPSEPGSDLNCGESPGFGTTDFGALFSALGEAVANDHKRRSRGARHSEQHRDEVVIVSDGIHDETTRDRVCPRSPAELVTERVRKSYASLLTSAENQGPGLSVTLVVVPGRNDCKVDVATLWQSVQGFDAMRIVRYETGAPILAIARDEGFFIEPAFDSLESKERSKLDKGEPFEATFRFRARRVRGTINVQRAALYEKERTAGDSPCRRGEVISAGGRIGPSSESGDGGNAAPVAVYSLSPERPETPPASEGKPTGVSVTLDGFSVDGAGPDAMEEKRVIFSKEVNSQATIDNCREYELLLTMVNFRQSGGGDPKAARPRLRLDVPVSDFTRRRNELVERALSLRSGLVGILVANILLLFVALFLFVAKGYGPACARAWLAELRVPATVAWLGFLLPAVGWLSYGGLFLIVGLSPLASIFLDRLAVWRRWRIVNLLGENFSDRVFVIVANIIAVS